MSRKVIYFSLALFSALVLANCATSADQKNAIPHNEISWMIPYPSIDPNSNAPTKDKVATQTLKTLAQTNPQLYLYANVARGVAKSIGLISNTTNLFILAKEADYRAAKSMLDGGADVNERMQDGITPLYVAAFYGNAHIVNLFLDNGADPNIPEVNGVTPLLCASIKNHVRIVGMLLEKGARLDFKDKEGWTPLMAASLGGHLAIVKSLLEKGADANESENDGITPLMLAAVAMLDHHEVIKFLVANGADINAVDKLEGSTALMSSAVNGDMGSVKFLIDKGADINVRNAKGRTALYYARINHNWITAEIIQSAGGVE